MRDLANTLIAASAALSGLVLVFLGATLNAFDQFAATEQDAIRAAYRARAWMGLWGLVLALAGGVLATLAIIWGEVVCLFLAGGAIVLCLLLLLVMATIAVWQV